MSGVGTKSNRMRMDGLAALASHHPDPFHRDGPTSFVYGTLALHAFRMFSSGVIER